MNYDSIAQLVNKMVKNPKSMLSKTEQRLSSTELRTNEFNIIQSVFTKYDVSGNTLTISALPLVMWM